MPCAAHPEEHAARTAPLHRALTEGRTVRKTPMVENVVKVKPSDARLETAKSTSQHGIGLDVFC